MTAARSKEKTAQDSHRKPRTVLYLHSSDDLYGADIILLQLVTGLDSALHRPIVILPDDMKHVGLLSRELEAAGIEYHHLPIAILRRRYFSPLGLLALLRRLFRGTAAIRRLTRRDDVTLLYGFTLAVVAAPVAAVVLGLPLLMHAHEILLQPRLLRKSLHALATRSADKVVCVSEAVRTNILEDQPQAAGKTVVVHNGIADAPATAEPSAVLRGQLGVPVDKPLVGMIGRVSAWKGQEVFVRAAAILQDQGVQDQAVQAHYLAIGGVFDGEAAHLEKLRETIIAERVTGIFTLTDFRKDARRYLPAFDIFVLPSTMPDPFPTVILEAMAAGIPVIATAHGGPLEMIVDGESGLLVAPDDPEALAAAVASLLADPERARRIGEAGRARFGEEFSLAKYLLAMEQLYSTIEANPDTGVP